MGKQLRKGNVTQECVCDVSHPHISLTTTFLSVISVKCWVKPKTYSHNLRVGYMKKL